MYRLRFSTSSPSRISLILRYYPALIDQDQQLVQVAIPRVAREESRGTQQTSPHHATLLSHHPSIMANADERSSKRGRTASEANVGHNKTSNP